jgi:hypothetical protein
MQELSRNRNRIENNVLYFALDDIFDSSSRCYKNRMIDIAFSDPKSVPREYLVKFFLYRCNSLVEKISLLERACLRMGEAIKGFVSSLFTEAVIAKLGLLSASNLKVVLRFLFAYGDINLLATIMIILSNNRRLELRLFADQMNPSFFVQKMIKADLFKLLKVCFSTKLQLVSFVKL